MKNWTPVLLPEKYDRANRILWAAIGLVVAADAVMILWRGIHVDFTGADQMIMFMALCGAVSFFCRYVKRDDNLALFGHVMNQIILTGFAIGFLNHLLSTYNFPLVDDSLLAVDRFFGFDWRHYLSWVSARPNTALLFSLSYESYGVQGILLICLLFIYKNPGQAQRMAMTSFFSVLLCILIGAVLPAMGMYEYYHIDPALYPNINPSASLIHVRVLSELRSQPLATLVFPSIGVVMFPSFHASMAVFLAYAAWPFTRLRLVLVPIDAMMAMSTPIEGGHYMIDAVAGIAITALCIVLAEKILPRGQ